MALEGLGWIMVLAGLAALVLPGPGLLLLFGGLALLSQQYAWAERRLAPVKVTALKTASDSVATRTRIALSTLGALLLLAAGVVWLLGPEQPRWWSLADATWLPGGAGAGISMVVSGLVALLLLVYSYQRFRVRGERPPTLEEELAEQERDERERAG